MPAPRKTMAEIKDAEPVMFDSAQDYSETAQAKRLEWLADCLYYYDVDLPHVDWRCYVCDALIERGKERIIPVPRGPIVVCYHHWISLQWAAYNLGHDLPPVRGGAPPV